MKCRSTPPPGAVYCENEFRTASHPRQSNPSRQRSTKPCTCAKGAPCSHPAPGGESGQRVASSRRRRSSSTSSLTATEKGFTSANDDNPAISPVRARAQPRTIAGMRTNLVVRLVLGGLVLLFLFSSLYIGAFHAPRAKGFDVGVVGTAEQAAATQSALDTQDRGA